MKTIKNLKTVCISTALLISNNMSHAQDANSKNKLKATVLNIDVKSISYDAVQMGNIVRLELEKTNKYQVMDKYDISNSITKSNLSIENCYGKACLSEIGKTIGADKMITGSVELIGQQIIIKTKFYKRITCSCTKACNIFFFVV